MATNVKVESPVAGFARITLHGMQVGALVESDRGWAYNLRGRLVGHSPTFTDAKRRVMADFDVEV